MFKNIDIIQIHSDSLFILNGRIINYSILLFKYLAKVSILDIRDKISIPNYDLGFSKYLANSEYILNKINQNIEVHKNSLIYSPIEIYPIQELKSLIINYETYKPYICFIGNLSNSKGVPQLLNAMQILGEKSQFDHIKLLLCGRSNIKTENLPHNVTHLGELCHKEAMAVLSQSMLLVLPSLSESLPRVCIEAFNYNKSVLISKGVKEIDKYLDNYLVLDEINSKKISIKIEELLLHADRKINYKYPLHLHNKQYVESQMNKVYNIN